MIEVAIVGLAFLFLGGAFAFTLADAKRQGRTEALSEVTIKAAAKSRASAQIIARHQSPSETIADLEAGRF